MNICVSYLMSLEDYRGYCLWRQTKRHAPLLQRLAPVCCPLLLVWMLLSVWAKGKVDLPMVSIFLVWIVLIVLFKDYLFPALVSYGAKREYESVREQLESKTVIISEDSLTVKTAYGEGTYPLSMLYQIEETKTLFVLQFGESQCEVLPKRVLSEQEILSLRKEWSQT